MKRLAALILLISTQAMAEVKIEETRLVSEAQSMRFIINLTQSPNYTVFSLNNPRRIVIDLSDTRLSSALPKVKDPNNPVIGIRSAVRHDHDLRVVLEVKDDVTSKNYILPPASKLGYRLVIELSEPTTVAPTTPSAPTLPTPAC